MDDTETLLIMIDLAVSNDNKEKVNIALNYGAAIFMCAFAEKITREIYASLIKDTQYVDTSKATLGELFSGRDEVINPIFGKRHANNLMFFLATVGEKRIGRNYRNKLAHLSEIKIDDIDEMFVARILWLFTDIINTWFWYYLKRDVENEQRQ